MKTTKSKGWFPMNIESLRNQIKTLSAMPAVKSPVVGPTVVILEGEPKPVIHNGVIITVKDQRTKDALSKGVAGGVLCDVGAGR
jgi:hypothetical protein